MTKINEVWWPLNKKSTSFEVNLMSYIYKKMQKLTAWHKGQWVDVRLKPFCDMDGPCNYFKISGTKLLLWHGPTFCNKLDGTHLKNVLGNLPSEMISMGRFHGFSSWTTWQNPRITLLNKQQDPLMGLSYYSIFEDVINIPNHLYQLKLDKSTLRHLMSNIVSWPKHKQRH